MGSRLNKRWLRSGHASSLGAHLTHGAGKPNLLWRIGANWGSPHSETPEIAAAEQDTAAVAARTYISTDRPHVVQHHGINA